MFNNVLDKDLIIAELLPDLPRVNEQLFLEIYLKSNTKIRVIKFGDWKRIGFETPRRRSSGPSNWPNYTWPIAT